MKASFASKTKCPDCGAGPLVLRVTSENPVEVREGELKCPSCGKAFAIRAGVPDLLPSGLHGLIDAERRGWIARAKEKGWYKTDPAYLLKLPDVDASDEEIDWRMHRGSFYYMVDRAFTDWRGKDVLDVGVGKPWSSRYLARKGARVTATEVIDDPVIGLGVAELYMKHDGTFFERVLADMHKLPFRDASFDIVFFQGSLHHSIHLWDAMREAERVLRPGGKLVFGREGSGGILSRESVGKPCPDGVNEHNYKNARYLYYLLRLGFRNIRTFHEPDFYEKHDNNPVWFWLYELWRFGRGGPLMLIAEKPQASSMRGRPR